MCHYNSHVLNFGDGLLQNVNKNNNNLLQTFGSTFESHETK